MGNKLGKKRQVVDERYTRPQGLYQHRDVDHKKLRKLILESKLAPCYLGDEECARDLEECPICFLYYPSLNRSRCCTKHICTECFLQIKMPNTTQPTQCPFCKTSNYAVEYRGTKTKEEKVMEQIEEQRVIEAKIRMRQQELQDDEERMQKRQDMGSSSSRMAYEVVDDILTTVSSLGEIVSSQGACSAVETRSPLRSRQIRDDEFDLDLEEIMVMEAIWRSIQERGGETKPTHGDALATTSDIRLGPYAPPTMAPLTEPSSSPPAGLACAVAALAEHQHIGGQSSTIYHADVSDSRMLPGCSVISQYEDDYPAAEVSIERDLRIRNNDVEWSADIGSQTAEAWPCYVSSDSSGIVASPCQDRVTGSFLNIPGRIIPESFEDQMILAMTVSLADARAMTSAEVAWH